MRKEYRYSYTICNQMDEDLFKKQCEAIENHVTGLTKKNFLEDVDGSAYQYYQHDNGEILVCNSSIVGALYVDSDFDLLPYFQHKENDQKVAV